MIERHSHTGLGNDWEKISFNNLKDKPFSFRILRLTRALNNTWSLSISSIGFTPKMIRIQAVKQTPTTWDFSDITGVWVWTDLTVFWIRVSAWWTQALISTSPQIITVSDWGNSCTATLTSLDDNWFTLNFSTVNFTTEFNVILSW